MITKEKKITKKYLRIFELKRNKVKSIKFRIINGKLAILFLRKSQRKNSKKTTNDSFSCASGKP